MRYKSIVRIIKSLCNEMIDQNITEAKTIPGFLNECLVWNVPDKCFGGSSYQQNVRASLEYLYNNTLSDAKCNEWGEVSELKYLFRAAQKWTQQQANSFILKAWQYLEF